RPRPLLTGRVAAIGPVRLAGDRQGRPNRNARCAHAAAPPVTPTEPHACAYSPESTAPVAPATYAQPPPESALAALQLPSLAPQAIHLPTPDPHATHNDQKHPDPAPAPATGSPQSCPAASHRQS